MLLFFCIIEQQVTENGIKERKKIKIFNSKLLRVGHQNSDIPNVKFWDIVDGKKKKFVLFSGDKKHCGHVKIEPTFYLWTVDSSLVRITVRDHELFTYLEQSGSKVILKIHFGLHVMCINALFFIWYTVVLVSCCGICRHPGSTRKHCYTVIHE